jgi:2'-5' RNA ligase
MGPGFRRDDASPLGAANNAMLRLFVGIPFPPELKLRLSLLCSGVAGAKWVDPGNFHLTLRFIGEVDEGLAADIDAALARVEARPFTLQLAGTGYFGDGAPRSLWVGVERNAELTALRDKIERALVRAGLPPEPRRFAPHVTLARLRNVASPAIAAFLSASAQFRAEPLAVEAYSLIASLQTKAGSVYEDQADYRLAD